MLQFGFAWKEIEARTRRVKANKVDDPLHIRALGVNRVMVEPQDSADFSKEF
jgi:hypothetical protein